MVFSILAFIVCATITILIAPIIIKLIKKCKANQNILEYVDNHFSKQGTPTMGGLIFLVAFILLFLSFIIYQKNNILATLIFLSTISFGVLGFLDDFIKIKYNQNLGLKPYQKIIGQLGISAIISYFIYSNNLVGTSIVIPFSNLLFDINWIIIPLAIFTIIAIVNSVNLIDGLDGLCCNTSIPTIFTFLIVLLVSSSNLDPTMVYFNEIKNIIILGGGFLGCLIGFRVLNTYPASIFMGDTGSLAIGGFIATLVVLTKNYLLFLIVGIIFVVTALSVVIQVLYYKKTKKRIFLMAPLHHHFEKKGKRENKIVAIYTFISIIISLICIFFYLLK